MSNIRDNSTDYMKVRTRGNSSPKCKPRVYFTCHPADFDKYFEQICADIFKTYDCAIYYTADMASPIPEIYRETDLGNMNLFVMPVTWRLLSEPSRAMDSDFAFADEKHYPVLPLMMELGIDSFYAEKFGKRQYLSPVIHDTTAIFYEEKLKKYLSAILIDDETADRIRAAFDAYIFLSYRKKDRHHANELMCLIHENPKYRDIAIWYDEYLTPGENFDNVIRKAMDKSELFALLVTPNLINEENYVHTVEYPAAKKAEKRILPAKMVDTDEEELRCQYENIPPCVNAHDRAELDDGLLEMLKDIAIQENDSDPEHNYLIGLAYLEGIDVETNLDRSTKLIVGAAEDGLPEAMEEMDNLATTYSKLGNLKKELELREKCYALHCKFLGEKDSRTLRSLSNLAVAYGNLIDYQKSLELSEKCYALRCKILGEKHPDTLDSLNNLASIYGKLGNQRQQLELNKKCYALQCEVLSESHPDTLISLNNLATTYGNLGENEKALELLEKCYNLICEIRGEQHPDTLAALNNLAVTYGNLSDNEQALKLLEKCYALSYEMQGEARPDTLQALSNLAITYGNLGYNEKTLELIKKCYSLRCKTLGEKHPNTLASMANLAFAYGKIGNHKKMLELLEKCYAMQCEVLGDEHLDTRNTLNGLISVYSNLGAIEKADELCRKLEE